jgi:hypothetical protein
MKLTQATSAGSRRVKITNKYRVHYQYETSCITDSHSGGPVANIINPSFAVMNALPE